jgi:hypothetical protein
MRMGSGGMSPLVFNLSAICLCLSVSGTVDFFLRFLTSAGALTPSTIVPISGPSKRGLR